MSLRPQRGNLAAVSTNAVASIPVCLQMSLRAQRGNLVTASTNAVASFRFSPNVIASAARQSRSRIDQRGRQLPIFPQCHCERSAAISQPHRPTRSPASDFPPMSLRAQRGNLAAASTNAVASIRLSPNVIASAAWQSRSGIDQRCRQHSIVPKCHRERSAAISQPHRPKSVTPAPSIIGSLPNILYPVRQSGWRNERSSRPCPTHHLE